MRIQKPRVLPTWLSFRNPAIFWFSMVFGGFLWICGPGGNPPAVEEALMRRRRQQRLEREREAVRKLEDAIEKWE